MSSKERVGIFIDGSNLYHKLKNKEINIKNTGRFDFCEFCNWLARDREIIFKAYYIGVVRAKADDKKAQNMRKSQQKLFSHLCSKSQNFVVRRGFMMKNDGAFHKKGVDVHLATDLLVGAYEDLWDTAIIVSSDTDLIPAIEKVKQIGKKVEYIGFAHLPSFGLQKYASLSRLLIKEDVQAFEYKNER